MNFSSGTQLLYFFMGAKIFIKFFSWTKWPVYQDPNSCTLLWGAKMHRLLLDIGHWLYGHCCRPILFILFPYYFHATFVLSLCYFNTISMLSSGYFATLYSCYFTDDARNRSNYFKTNYPLEENGMYQRLLYLFTRFEVLPNSNWHQKSVFRENCLKWKLSVEIPYFAFSSCQHLTLWNTNTTIRLV